MGYKELFNYLDGEWELDFALDRMRKNTRVYAKKQLTWFKRDESIYWFHPEEHSICDRLHDIVAAYKNVYIFAGTALLPYFCTLIMY